VPFKYGIVGLRAEIELFWRVGFVKNLRMAQHIGEIVNIK